jgi:hypothetical protein
MTEISNPTSTYDLLDADTADRIGTATTEQVAASLDAGPTGIIVISVDGDPIDASQENLPWCQPVRRVYVTEA